MRQRKEINYTKEMVMAIIEEIGNNVKIKTQPGYHSAEDNYRMKYEQKRLNTLRQAYKMINNGGDFKVILHSTSNIIGGIEGNKLNLVADGLSLTEWEEGTRNDAINFDYDHP